MEEITDGVNAINLVGDAHKKNRIQVSNTKKPLFFYVNLAKVSLSLSLWVDLLFSIWVLGIWYGYQISTFYFRDYCNVGYDLLFLY